ncbi:hypothetical protein D3C83_129870 [compost metagenome]
MSEISEIRPRSRRNCVHHWLLGDPAQGTIRGQCRLCRATRTFPASPESTQRFDDYRELTAPSSYGLRLSA